ncbi:MAG: hypothetical protein EZS28_038098 [Streblomastix strix]|uniref:Uncharacterized protein n=1 Tax=Streblomastix strix TaxID=222440 RepID=A0A5J4U6A6_9EUKA|nr:MAG: hypothetical protein EZS28_038098 [Streblomastix strix]
MLSTRAVFDGSHLELIINGPPQSIQKNILYVLDASVPTNAITQSPAFGLASWAQLLNKYPFGNIPVVAYDAVSVILSRQTINYGSEPLYAKKFYRSSYELKSNFVIAFGTGGSNSSFDAQMISSLFITCHCRVWSPIGTDCGGSPIGLGQRSLIYAYNSGNSDKPAAANNLSSIQTFDIYIQQKQIINSNNFKQQQAEASKHSTKLQADIIINTPCFC